MSTVIGHRVLCDCVQKGNTALHYICQRKSHRLVPLLLEKNADTNIQNNVRTQTHHNNKVSHHQTEIRRPLLLQDGETPLDIAKRLKFTKIVKMLKKAH